MQEIVVAVCARGQKQVGDVVGDYPVDLLGHGTVTAAQTGLEVDDGHVQFCRHESAGAGGVDIASNTASGLCRHTTGSSASSIRAVCQA